MRAEEAARRHLFERSHELIRLIQLKMEIPAMAILDVIDAQIAASEATDAAAAAKIGALASENTTLKQQLVDLTAETAKAQALADRLKIANDPLQAAITAAG